jgi:hypothetical protein
MDVGRELIPGDGLGFSEPGELIETIVQPAAQRGIAELDAVHHDDGKLCGQTAILRKVEQGRHEFPPGQVTGSAKNDEHRRFKLVVCFHRFHFLLFYMKCAFGIAALISVGSEIQALLGLDEIGSQPRAEMASGNSPLTSRA